MHRSYRRGGRHSRWWHSWGGGPWWGLLLIVLVFVVLCVLGLVFVPGLTRGHMGWFGGVCPWCGGRGMMGGWGLFGTVLALGLGLGFIILVAIGVLALVQGESRGGPFWGRSSPTAREILDERYARGEITEEEYRRRREQMDT